MFKNRTPAEMMAKVTPGKKMLGELKPKSKSESGRKAHKAGKKESVIARFDAYR